MPEAKLLLEGARHGPASVVMADRAAAGGLFGDGSGALRSMDADALGWVLGRLPPAVPAGNGSSAPPMMVDRHAQRGLPLAGEGGGRVGARHHIDPLGDGSRGAPGAVRRDTRDDR